MRYRTYNSHDPSGAFAEFSADTDEEAINIALARAFGAERTYLAELVNVPAGETFGAHTTRRVIEVSR